MKPCDREMGIAKAVRTGRWSPEAQAHLASCPSCAEAAQAARWMQTLARPADLPAPSGTKMQEASWLWCRALLEQKEAEARRARRRMATVEYATALTLTLGSGAWLAWSWPQLQALFTAWQASLWAELWRAAWFLAGQAPMLASLPAVSVLALLLAAAAFLLAQPLLAED